MTTWPQLLLFAVVSGATQAAALLALIFAGDAVKDWRHERRMQRAEKRAAERTEPAQRRGGRR